MNIIELRAENFKRLRAIRVVTDGKKLITVSGRNAQGKTSVIDSIAAAIGGMDHVPAVPVRAGQKQATILLRVGDLTITRVINPDRTGSLLVEQNGAVVRSPQKTLDKFASQLTLDPMEFMNLKASDRIEALKKLVPSFDFRGNTKARGDAYDRRTELGREYRRMKGALDSMPVLVGDRPEKVDTAATIAALHALNERNVSRDNEFRRREGWCRSLNEVQKRIEKLRSELASASQEVLDLQDEIDGWEPLREHEDPAPLSTRIDNAIEIDRQIELFDRRTALTTEIDKSQTELRRLDELIQDLDEARNLAIRNAKLPVEGLGFGADDVTIDDLPFVQASSSQQLAVATGITMALRPELKIILIRQGPLLDEDHLVLLASIAAKRGYQLWVERIEPRPDTNTTVGVLIEDGEIIQ